MNSTSFDYVIVGRGLAGIVIASRLSEDEKNSVLVIEAGEDQLSDDRVNISGMWMTLANTSSAYKWKTVPQARTNRCLCKPSAKLIMYQEGLNGREVEVMQGRMLGGSTGLNGLNFAVTSAHNVNAWESLGNPGWAWPEFQAFMQKAYTPAANSESGDGPIRLSVPGEETGWSRAWLDTLSSLGYKTDKDSYSSNINGGFTLPDTVDSKTAQRSYARNAYLKERPNCTVWTNAKAQKILFDETPEVRATGVKVARNGSAETLTARKEVTITAGTIHSPQILEASGVGNSSRLKDLGLQTVIDLPGVGENLQNHPLAGLCFEAKDEPGYDTLDGLACQEPDAIGSAMAA